MATLFSSEFIIPRRRSAELGSSDIKSEQQQQQQTVHHSSVATSADEPSPARTTSTIGVVFGSGWSLTQRIGKTFSKIRNATSSPKFRNLYPTATTPHHLSSGDAGLSQNASHQPKQASSEASQAATNLPNLPERPATGCASVFVASESGSPGNNSSSVRSSPGVNMQGLFAEINNLNVTNLRLKKAERVPKGTAKLNHNNAVQVLEGLESALKVDSAPQSTSADHSSSSSTSTATSSKISDGAREATALSATTEGTVKSVTRVPKPPSTRPPAVPKLGRLELEGGRNWIVENFENAPELLRICSLKKRHIVQMRDCKKTRLEVEGKVTNVALENLTDCAVNLAEVMGNVEVTRCRKLRLYAGPCKFITLDSSTSVTITLSREGRDVQMLTSNCNEINVLFPQKMLCLTTATQEMGKGTAAGSEVPPQEEEEIIERPIPYQFVHTITPDGQIESRVSDLYR